jgi:hypothetical protein
MTGSLHPVMLFHVVHLIFLSVVRNKIRYLFQQLRQSTKRLLLLHKNVFGYVG